MLHDLITKGLSRALVLGGALVLALLTALSPASSVEYPACVETTTDLTLDSSIIRAGSSTTARVQVTSDAGTPQGTVTLQVSGGAAVTKALVKGGASWTVPGDLEAGRTYEVTARANGKGEWCASMDAANLTVTGGDVAGVSDDDGDDGDVLGASAGDDGVIGASAGDTAGLPSIGMESSTQIAALVGFALLAAGIFSLVLYRRRGAS